MMIPLSFGWISTTFQDLQDEEARVEVIPKYNKRSGNKWGKKQMKQKRRSINKLKKKKRQLKQAGTKPDKQETSASTTTTTTTTTKKNSSKKGSVADVEREDCEPNGGKGDKGTCGVTVKPPILVLSTSKPDKKEELLHTSAPPVREVDEKQTGSVPLAPVDPEDIFDLFVWSAYPSDKAGMHHFTYERNVYNYHQRYFLERTVSLTIDWWNQQEDYYASKLHLCDNDDDDGTASLTTAMTITENRSKSRSVGAETRNSTDSSRRSLDATTFDADTQSSSFVV